MILKFVHTVLSKSKVKSQKPERHVSQRFFYFLFFTFSFAKRNYATGR